jgi:hypothetical protein
MSFDSLDDVNYLAVAVAAIAWFVLGAVWYAPPVFGGIWMRSIGMQMPEGFRPNALLFVGTFVAYLVTALALAMLSRATGSDTFGEGLVLGVVTAVGFALAGVAVGALYERRSQPLAWFGVTGVFNLLGYLVVAVIVTVSD